MCTISKVPHLNVGSQVIITERTVLKEVRSAQRLARDTTAALAAATQQLERNVELVSEMVAILTGTAEPSPQAMGTVCVCVGWACAWVGGLGVCGLGMWVWMGVWVCGCGWVRLAVGVCVCVRACGLGVCGLGVSARVCVCGFVCV